MPKGENAKRAEFATTALPHMDKIYSTALYLCRDPDDAADLLQETFLRAYRSWDQFSLGTNCKAWLLTILQNAFRNRYRAQRSAPAIVTFDEGLWSKEYGRAVSAPANDPADLVASQALDGEIEAALRSLPQEYLEVVLLVDMQDLTYEEAASAAGCPIGTVRSRLSRGRRLLYDALQQYARERGLLRSR